MSSFNGQMKEYTRIALDRFDGKNLQCTAFFLSHCHKDHMVGLDRSVFINCLSTSNGVYLYCSDITRLLLVSDTMYSHLVDYLKVLKIGISQPIRVPSRGSFEKEYYVNVTPISAGHCPGSVMFLFDGLEGTCLYTGDFRWEISQAAKVSAFKQKNGLRSIKSLYVDTTFCIPEAYHIPTRKECVEAAVALVSNWLKRSSLHIVFVYCPARYGQEHLLMELSKALNTKVHVPDWKVNIYDQIPGLENSFTADPSQSRIHACSIKVGSTSCLSQYKNPGNNKPFKVLKLRPSTMWFTSGKSISKTDDLIVEPVSQRGLYRICYSMHSSYSEIRDLVSYLQPKQVYPNVLPMSDTSMNVVQTRLNSFQKYLNKARVLPSVTETCFQPLGVLRKTLVVHTYTNEASSKQDTGGPDELIFSSQESRSEKDLKLSATRQSTSNTKLFFPTEEKSLEECRISETAQNIKSSVGEVCNSTDSQPVSSYQNSVISGEEYKLFSSYTDDDEMIQTNQDNCDHEDIESSCPNYISGDSSVDNSSDDSDVDLKDDYYNNELNPLTSEINIPGPGKTCTGSSTVSQSKLDAFKTSNFCASDKIVEDMQQKQEKMNFTFSCAKNSSSLEISKNFESHNKLVKNEKKNIFHDENPHKNKNSGENDEVIYSSQVTLGVTQNSINKTVFQNSSHLHQNGKISASPNNLVKDTKSNSLTLLNLNDDGGKETLNLKDDDGKETETLIICSSPDDSEKESQTLWSVKYSLDHFISSHFSLNKNGQEESYNFSVIEGTKDQHSHNTLQHLQYNKTRENGKPINKSSLKRKHPSYLNINNASNKQSIKRLNNAKASEPYCVNSAIYFQSNCVQKLKDCASVEGDDEVLVDRKDNCTLSSKKEKGNTRSNNLIKFQSDLTLDNSKTKDNDFSLSDLPHHQLKSSNSQKHFDCSNEVVLPKIVQMCDKSNCIDLTVELENYIDLTLDSSQ